MLAQHPDVKEIAKHLSVTHMFGSARRRPGLRIGQVFSDMLMRDLEKSR
jgi:hypothetical protein